MDIDSELAEMFEEARDISHIDRSRQTQERAAQRAGDFFRYGEGVAAPPPFGQSRAPQPQTQAEAEAEREREEMRERRRRMIEDTRAVLEAIEAQQQAPQQAPTAQPAQPPPAAVQAPLARSVRRRASLTRRARERRTKLHFAKLPQSLLYSGIFRSRPRGQRGGEWTTVWHGLTFAGREGLGADDLRTLLAVVALAGRDGAALTQHPSESDRAASAARDALALEGLCAADASLLVAITPGEIAEQWSVSTAAADSGAYSGAGQAAIMRSLERLAATRITTADGAAQMISVVPAPNRAGGVAIALHPMLAGSIRSRGQHTRIEFLIARGLSDSALIAYAWLATWMAAWRATTVRHKATGETQQRRVSTEARVITTDGLARHLYPDDQRENRMRTARAREILRELRDRFMHSTTTWSLYPPSAAESAAAGAGEEHWRVVRHPDPRLKRSGPTPAKTRNAI